MPKLITDAGEIMKTFSHLEKSKENRATYDALMSSKFVVLSIENIKLDAGYMLIRIDERQKANHFEIALVSTARKAVVYYNLVTISPDVALGKNAKPATQVLVWRSSKPEHRTALYNVANAIFTDYLLRSYSVIVTDNHQTNDGYAFWRRRIYDALEANLFIYGYEQMTGKLEKVTSEEEFEDMQDHYWSEEEGAEFMLFIISSDNLPLDNPPKLDKFD